MASKTKNYNLHKIDATDAPPDITVLNQNWDAIDSKFKELDGKVGSTTLSDTVNNHIKNTTVHVTAEERAAWNAKQNAIKVGNTSPDEMVDSLDVGDIYVYCPTLE